MKKLVYHHDCLNILITPSNGIEISMSIPERELKRIIVSLGEREYSPGKLIEMLLLGLGLEEA